MARKRTALLTLVALATAGAMTTALWRTSDLGRVAADLERQRSAARREGVPTEWNDVRRLTPAVPDGENAAILYTAAFEGLKGAKGLNEFGNDRLLRAVAAGNAKPEELAAARKRLLADAPLLEEAKSASHRREIAFDHKWEQGFALSFPEFASFRTLGRALVLRAMLAQDPASAADDLRAAARMRAHVASEPVLIASLVGNGLEGDVHRAIRHLARRGGFWPVALAPVLDDLGPIPALRRTLASEAVAGMRFDKELGDNDPAAFSGMDGSQAPVVLRLIKVPVVRDAAMSRVYEYWRGVWAKLPGDPADFRAARTALAVPRGQGPSYVLLEFLLPVFEGFTEVNARSEADRRLTREALALWKGETLRPEGDPFGRGPLRLRREGKRWTLYSVGPNGVDDGGKPRAKNVDRDYDLVVEG